MTQYFSFSYDKNSDSTTLEYITKENLQVFDKFINLFYLTQSKEPSYTEIVNVLKDLKQVLENYMEEQKSKV